MVFGTFDILHPGHIHMLKEAERYGDSLVIIVAKDSTVKKIKGRLPIHSETVRLKSLEALAIADRVRLGNSGDKHQVIREEKPDVIALGYDQKFFTEGLDKVLEKPITIVRLSPYKPEIYKSSKLASAISHYQRNPYL